MSESAFQTQYRNETILGFEKRESLLRKTVTKEAMFSGNTATFLVTDSGGAEAVTRGLNGKIPSRANDDTQFECPLTEWHDKPIATGFNIFASQGQKREQLQVQSMGVINRKIDRDIREGLSATALTAGAAAVATLAKVLKVKTILRNNFADGRMHAVITPAFHAELMEIQQFTSADYVQDSKFEGVGKDNAFDWLGCTYVVDADIVGVGTSSAECYFYSDHAIGHACNTDSMETHVGYDAEDDYSFARCSIYMGTKLIQPTGVVKYLHDDSVILA